MASDSAWRPVYPFTPHYLSLRAHRMHFVDEGAGRPVLMVHGNPTWSFYFRNLITAFRSRYRIVAVDHMGCGLSDKPQDYPYTLQQHVENLVALIDQLELDQITLAAHDWGGAIGLGAALARPSRFKQLVLFNTGAFPPPYIPWRIRLCRFPFLGTWAVRRWNLFARAALTMAVGRNHRLSPQAKAGLLAPYDSWDHRIAIDRFVKDIPNSPQDAAWRQLEQIEKGLRQFADRPCQLIWGMQDWCFRPSCLQRFQEIFPTAEIHRLADASHYVVEEAHERIVELMGPFLEKTN